MPRIMHHTRLAALAALTLIAGPAPAQQNFVPGTPYLVVESGQRFNRLQDALGAIGDGKGTIRIDPGQWDDCAVQIAGDVTFEAAVPGKTIFSGPRNCEGKAALVLRGRASRVTGLIFTDERSSEGNQAGIRLEKGNLYVSQVWFKDSDEGILSANDANGHITVEQSTFSRLGRCGGYAGCAHSIYANFYASVTVRHCRFEGGRGGHYLKSRAARIDASDNSFDDSQGQATNYMIDLPAGAKGRIAGNWFVQGSHKENGTAMIAVAAEEHPNSSAGLVIENNVARLAPGAGATVWVADWSGERLALGANELAGSITPYQRR